MTIDTQWIVIGGIMAAVVGAVITGLFTLAARRIREPPTRVGPLQSTARIEQPASGQKVSRGFAVAGEHGEIPESCHLWLAIKIGSLLWPKEPEVSKMDRRFSVKIVEGGNPPGGRFALSLFQVSAKGHRYIVRWIETGRKTDEWPGIDPRELDGFSQLDFTDDVGFV